MDFKEGKNFMYESTGWNEQEIYQLHAVLFRKLAFTQSQFEQNLNTAMKANEKLSQETKDKLKAIMMEFDADDLHFRIKNHKDIVGFGDEIMANMQDLLAINKTDDVTEIFNLRM